MPSAFHERGGLILGICNGFQVLVKAGLLPGGRGPRARPRPSRTTSRATSNRAGCGWRRRRDGRRLSPAPTRSSYPWRTARGDSSWPIPRPWPRSKRPGRSCSATSTRRAADSGLPGEPQRLARCRRGRLRPDRADLRPDAAPRAPHRSPPPPALDPGRVGPVEDHRGDGLRIFRDAVAAVLAADAAVGRRLSGPRVRTSNLPRGRPRRSDRGGGPGGRHRGGWPRRSCRRRWMSPGPGRWSRSPPRTSRATRAHRRRASR